MLIFEDSITTNISLSAIANCDEIQAINYSTSGSKFRGVYEQLRAFKKVHGDTSVKQIIIHVETNHLPRDNPVDVAKKPADVHASKEFEMMVHASKKFPKIYFSAILPKLGKSLKT